jgi:hypothetical protein
MNFLLGFVAGVAVSVGGFFAIRHFLGKIR